MVQKITQRSPNFQPLAPVTYLPNDVTLLFIRLLPGPQIVHLRRVCKYFAQVVNNENLWTRLCQQDFPSRAIPSNMPPLLHYQRCYRTEQNWRKGCYVYRRFVTGVWQPVLSLKGTQFICNGRDLSLQIWDLKQNSSTPTHKLPTMPSCDAIDYLEDNELVIIAMTDYAIPMCLKVWDKSNGQPLWSFEEGYRPMVVDQTGIFLLTDEGSFIKLWDRKTHQIKTLISNVNGSDFLKLDASLLFTATPSGILKCWNKDNGTFFRQFGSGQDGKIQQAIIDNSLLICLYHNGTVKSWKKEDGSLVYELSIPAGRIEHIFIDEDVIMATCKSDRKYSIACWNKANGKFHFQLEFRAWKLYLQADRFICAPLRTDIENLEYLGNIEIRDKYTGSLINTCRTGGNDIEITHSDSHRIFSLINRNTLKIWDIRTGDLLFTLNKISYCKVLNDRMIIVDKDGNIDICDFSDKPEIPFPHKGQLPTPPKL